MSLVTLGTATHRATILTKTSTGALVNADSLPTILNVQKNGVDADESAVSVVQAQDDTPANITGMYHLVIDLSGSGLNAIANDQFTILVQSTIQGSLRTQSYTFSVFEASGALPQMDIG